MTIHRHQGYTQGDGGNYGGDAKNSAEAPKRLEHGGKHAVWRKVAGPYLFGMAQDVFVAPGGDFLVEAQAGRPCRTSVGIFRLKRGNHAPDAQLDLSDMVLRDAKAFGDLVDGELFKYVCAR